MLVRHFGRLDSTIRKRTADAILKILISENPACLGKYKANKFSRTISEESIELEKKKASAVLALAIENHH